MFLIYVFKYILYFAVTERAREKGISISVITIKGTSCLLPVIGQMVESILIYFRIEILCFIRI